MKITYIGNDSECSTKICNYLSNFHELTLITDRSPLYETDCKVIIKSDLWYPNFFDEYDSELVIYNCTDEDHDLLNKWLCASKEKVREFFIIKQGSFTNKSDGEISIENLLKNAYSDPNGTHVRVFNISTLYGSVTVPESLKEIIKNVIRNNVIEIPDGFYSMCDALHIDDFCLFLEKAIEQTETLKEDELYVRSGYSFSSKSLFKKIGEFYPQATEKIGVLSESFSPAELFRPKGWSPDHSLLEDIDNLIIYTEDALKQSGIKKKKKLFSFFGKIAFFIVAFLLMEIYTNYMSVASELQFIDLRIAFIAFAAVILGKKYSVTAAVLCSAANILQSLSAGYRWHVIFFNVNNWIPVAIYILFATLIGTVADKLKKADPLQDRKQDFPRS